MLGENSVGLSFGLGPTFRAIFGDPTPEFRQAVLGGAEKAYYGGEGFFAITVNGITAFTQLYGIRRSNGNSISGLTGLNAVFGVTVRGNLFKLDIRRDNASATATTGSGSGGSDGNGTGDSNGSGANGANGTPTN